MHGAAETYEEWSARWEQEWEACVRTNQIFSEGGVDRIVQKVGKPASDRGALGAELERLPQIFASWDFANDRPPDGQTKEWFNALEHDLKSVCQRLANPAGEDADLLRRLMVMMGMNPDDIAKIFSIFEGLRFATNIVSNITRDESYRRGRIEWLTAEHWLIGEALPRIYSQHFGSEIGFARNKKTKKPDSPGIRFIVEVMSMIGVLDRDGKPFEPTAVEHYVRAAPLRSRREGLENVPGKSCPASNSKR
jgi:hypothetical protein